MFAHRLALELHCPVKDILAMPLSDYLNWLEYFSRIKDMEEGKVELANLDPEQIARAFGATVS